MAYTILNNNGTLLARVADASINTTSTNLTLVGRDYSGFGIYYNQNLITLLSNSAFNAPPPTPIQGELWYDTVTKQLKVYDTYFRSISAAVVSDSFPSSPDFGTFWFDGTNQVLNFFGPNGPLSLSTYPVGQTTGWVSPLASISDTSNIQHDNVTLLYNNDPSTAVGVISDTPFIASTATSFQYLTASSQTNTNIVAGLNIFGGIQITGDLNVDNTSITDTPVNTVTPSKWLKIKVSGTTYYTPLYQ